MPDIFDQITEPASGDIFDQIAAPSAPKGRDLGPYSGLNNVIDLAKGAARGAGSTIYNLGKLAHKAGVALGRPAEAITGINTMEMLSPDRDGAFAEPGADNAAGQQEVAALLEPEGPWQEAGMTAEQIAEFFLPGASKAGALSRVAQLTGKAGLVGRMGVESASAAGVTAAQDGDPLLGAAAGAAGPLVGKVAGAVAPALANTMLGARSALFRTGANAGAAIADEGIVAATPSGLVKHIIRAKDAVGREINNLFASSPQANMVTVDISQAVIRPVDEAIMALNAAGNAAGVRRLEALRDGVTDAITAAGGSLQAVTPRAVHDIRVLLDKGIKHGGAEGVEASAKEVTKAIRRNLSEVITQAVPESAPLNRRYANLAAAEDAAWAKANGSHGVPSLLGRAASRVAGGGTLGYVLGGGDGSRLGAGASMVAGSTAGGTLATAALSAIGGPKAATAMPKVFAAMASQATRDLHEEAKQQAGGDPAVARQIMLSRQAVYVAPDGTETVVPNNVANATMNGDPDAENTPLSSWMVAMLKQKRIMPGGSVIFVDR